MSGCFPTEGKLVATHLEDPHVKSHQSLLENIDILKKELSELKRCIFGHTLGEKNILDRISDVDDKVDDVNERVDVLEMCKDYILKECKRVDEGISSLVNKYINRIEKLESHYYSAGDLSALHGEIDNIHNNDKHRDFEIERLNKRVDELEKEISDLRIIIQNHKHKPFKCPICEASWEAMRDKNCIACEGKGIVWG